MEKKEHISILHFCIPYSFHMYIVAFKQIPIPNAPCQLDKFMYKQWPEDSFSIHLALQVHLLYVCTLQRDPSDQTVCMKLWMAFNQYFYDLK